MLNAFLSTLWSIKSMLEAIHFYHRARWWNLFWSFESSRCRWHIFSATCIDSVSSWARSMWNWKVSFLYALCVNCKLENTIIYRQVASVMLFCVTFRKEYNLSIHWARKLISNRRLCSSEKNKKSKYSSWTWRLNKKIIFSVRGFVLESPGIW